MIIEDATLDQLRIPNRIERVSERLGRRIDLSAREADMLDYMSKLSERFGDEKIPVVSSHGDFWPRNVMTRGRARWVVDWDGFRRNELPFQDLFLFAASYALVYPWRPAHWVDPCSAFRAALLNRTWLSALFQEYFQEYCRAMNLSRELLDLFFPLFLAERVLTLCKKSPRSSGELEIWRALLRDYAVRGGSICFG